MTSATDADFPVEIRKQISKTCDFKETYSAWDYVGTAALGCPAERKLRHLSNEGTRGIARVVHCIEYESITREERSGYMNQDEKS